MRTSKTSLDDDRPVKEPFLEHLSREVTEIEQLSLRNMISPQSDVFKRREEGFERFEDEDFTRRTAPMLKKPLETPPLKESIFDSQVDKAEEISQFQSNPLSSLGYSPMTEKSVQSQDRQSAYTIRLEELNKDSDPISIDGSVQEPSSIKVSPQSFRNHTRTRVLPKRVNLIEEARLVSNIRESSRGSDTEYENRHRLGYRSP